MKLFSKNKDGRKTKKQTLRRSPTNTYYRSETADDKASPFVKRTPPRRFRKYVFRTLDIVLLVFIVTGLGYSLMIKPNPKVVSSSTSFHTVADYQSVAAAQLKHLNNRNKITFSQQALISDLKKRFPEISSAQVELPLFSEQPTIYLTISKASFFLMSQGSRYIIDSSGKTVALADSLPGITKLPSIDDKSGFETGPGRQVLSANSVAFIETVIAETRRGGVPLASLSLPAVPQELDLRTSDQPYFVKFYLGGDPLAQAGQFLAARQHFKDAHQQPGQYLDVRVAGKIFYK
jgi:hypothetical protein